MPPRYACLAAALAVCAALVRPGAAQAQVAEASCALAGQSAEQQWSLPAGLLGAIGQVESGRRGLPGAWPWTINAAGQGYHFDSKEEAINVVRALQSQGVRSIDVGCYQINLQHHPHAFASLDEAFDPGANALYAGRFLGELLARTGSWDGAIGAYHSATPGRGDAYRARVMAAWTGGAPRAAAFPSGGILIPVAATMPLPQAGAMQVWTVSTQAMGVKVWSAGGAQAAALPRVLAGAPPPRPGSR